MLLVDSSQLGLEETAIRLEEQVGPHISRGKVVVYLSDVQLEIRMYGLGWSKN